MIKDEFIVAQNQGTEVVKMMASKVEVMLPTTKQPFDRHIRRQGQCTVQSLLMHSPDFGLITMAVTGFLAIEKDIPHRSKISALIVEAFKDSYKALIQEIDVCITQAIMN
jgi:hypothetical protein